MVSDGIIIKLGGLEHLGLSLLFFAYCLLGLAFEVTLLILTTLSIFFLLHFRATKLDSTGVYGEWCLG